MYLLEKSPPRSLGEMSNRPACPRANNNSRAGWKQMSNDDIDSLDTDKWIDRVCDAFERSWLDRKKADIQPVLADVPEQYRSKLLLQLIGIDIEQGRTGAGAHRGRTAHRGHPAIIPAQGPSSLCHFVILETIRTYEAIFRASRD